MSNDTEFLARWSRRKHDAATDKIKQSKQIETSDSVASETTPAAFAPGENRLPFDPASLPTIESIGAESNIRAFLEAGVPDDLARAALRRAWSLDPAIRDFVGLSENSWDFNGSGTIAGFGPIDGEAVRRLLTRLVGGPDTAVHPSLSTPANDRQRQAGESKIVEQQRPNIELMALGSAQPALDEVNLTGSAARHDETVASPRGSMSAERRSANPRRSHGGALPNTDNTRKETHDGKFLASRE